MARFNPSTYNPTDDSSSLAVKLGADTKTLALIADEGKCGCGCNKVAARRFLPGHDARLKGKLSRALATNTKVTLIKTEGKRPDLRVVTPAAAIKAFGWDGIVRPAASSNGSAKPARKTAKKVASRGKARKG